MRRTRIPALFMDGSNERRAILEYSVQGFFACDEMAIPGDE